jgi:hypothetical protein
MCRLGLVLAVAALMAAPALAQRGGRGGMFGGAPGVGQLINNKGVQEELKMTPDQVTKAGEGMRSVFEKFRDDFGRFQEMSQEERAALQKKMNDETQKAAADILKPEQTKRLKQIQLQVEGPQAFANADVVTSLKLKDDQKDKIKTINQDVTKDRQEIFQGARAGGFDPNAFQEMQKKIATLNKEAMGKIALILTPEQKKTWEEMTGKPFDYKPEFGQRRGRGN